MTIRILRFSAALLLAGTLLLGHGTGIVSLLGAETTAASFYVAPNGSPNGDGSIGNPWNLQTALSQPAAVKPGDTIWVRGGTYTGGVGWAYSFSSTLKGAAGLPISVRQYPGERATIDGRGAVYGALLVQYSAWTLFQNLEITDSDVARSPLTSGLWVRDSNNIKFINMVVHDLPGQGIGFWQENSDSEIYGTLIYYNGVDFQEHGIYTGNQVGTKRISDNIIFTNAGYGVHGYASTATGYENNIRIEGNIAFDNGLLVPGAPPQGNILIGTTSASSPAANPAIFNNATYHRTINMGAGSQEFGYVNGCTLPLVSGNYFVGETRWANCTTNASITGNTFYGNQVSYSGPLPSASTFPSNVYTTSRPTGFRVVVRGNQYEAGRAGPGVQGLRDPERTGLAAEPHSDGFHSDARSPESHRRATDSDPGSRNPDGRADDPDPAHADADPDGEGRHRDPGAGAARGQHAESEKTAPESQGRRRPVNHARCREDLPPRQCRGGPAPRKPSKGGGSPGRAHRSRSRTKLNQREFVEDVYTSARRGVPCVQFPPVSCSPCGLFSP
ncbi:MAG: right-handed parallel beta-helix repeat-containing protein [Acidobacteria bacterium]|nr:right-handed parallel beta-helix repeat-containing protein [Acidobacteriota bacterium]